MPSLDDDAEYSKDSCRIAAQKQHHTAIPPRRISPHQHRWQGRSFLMRCMLVSTSEGARGDRATQTLNRRKGWATACLSFLCSAVCWILSVAWLFFAVWKCLCVRSSQHTMLASETVSCNAQAPNRMSLEYVGIIREMHGKKWRGCTSVLAHSLGFLQPSTWLQHSTQLLPTI
jgi:hypothetical protein